MTIRTVLEKLYSDGSYDEEFPTDPKRYTRIEDALTSIASEIEGMKKDKDTILDAVKIPVRKDEVLRLEWEIKAYNLAITEVVKMVGRSK